MRRGQLATCTDHVQHTAHPLRRIQHSIRLVTKQNTLIGALGALGLVLGNTGSGAADLLPPVLGLLDLLTRRVLRLAHTVADHAALGLELLESVLGVVDEGEAGGAASAELGLEAEDDDELGGRLVHGAEGLLELRAGGVGLAGVDDVHDHLAALEEGVLDELARADGDRVGHGCWVLRGGVSVCKRMYAYV